MFLVVSVLLFVVHIPLLDRAERSRQAFLTGGTRDALVRTGVRREARRCSRNIEVPLLDQGSVQFILLTVMILVVCFLIWITISALAARLARTSRSAAFRCS